MTRDEELEMEARLGGRWHEIAELDCSVYAQEVQLECECTIVCLPGAQGMAPIGFRSVVAGCAIHGADAIGVTRYVGLKTRVWCAPDTLLVSDGRGTT